MVFEPEMKFAQMAKIRFAIDILIFILLPALFLLVFRFVHRRR